MQDVKIGIVVSVFNESVTSALLKGALQHLKQEGIGDEQIELVSVPGAFEIGLAAKVLTESIACDAVLCLGAVIRGETPHFDYICESATRSIEQLNMETGIPHIFGVLTVDTLQQAQDRSVNPVGNKGIEAAQTALEMVRTLRRLRSLKR